MAEGASEVTRIPVRIPDCFLLAMDAFMRRTGQGEHITQSIIEIEKAPDLAKLRPALVRLVQKHPLIVARLKRNWRTWLPFWEVPKPPDSGIPLGLYRESGSPGALGTGAVEVSKGLDRLQEIMGESLDIGGVHFNLRLDVVELRNGRCYVALSWRHTLIDGKGAELMFSEIARLVEGVDLPTDPPEQEKPWPGFKELQAKTKPAINRFEDLAKMRFASLCGPKARAGRGHYRVYTLSEADSVKVRERCESMVGPLFPMAYYVGLTARAHQKVFDHRGTAPGGYVASVPIQTRKRGAKGPLFHNRVTVFFFGAKPEMLKTLEEAATAMKQQFAEMSRARMDESFNAVLEMMMRLPSFLFMTVVRLQFRGEVGSFFHSHTGAFAPELTEFAGAKITNAFHLPCLGTPPGTGLFFNERDGRLTIVVSWREGCLSEEECRVMLGQALEDLLGEPRPDLLDAHL